MRTVPPYLDLFGLVILLGVAQALFLGIFFLTGDRGKTVANRCLGWMMLSISAVSGEIFLGYSNYLFGALAWVDFSEPLNFVMAPCFFCTSLPAFTVDYPGTGAGTCCQLYSGASMP